jgi:hypothetical protein
MRKYQHDLRKQPPGVRDKRSSAHRFPTVAFDRNIENNQDNQSLSVGDKHVIYLCFTAVAIHSDFESNRSVHSQSLSGQFVKLSRVTIVCPSHISSPD